MIYYETMVRAKYNKNYDFTHKWLINTEAALWVKNFSEITILNRLERQGVTKQHLWKKGNTMPPKWVSALRIKIRIDCNRSGWAQQVKQLRSSMDLTQAGFARLLNVRTGTVSQWELGNCVPDLRLFWRYQVQLELSKAKSIEHILDYYI